MSDDTFEDIWARTGLDATLDVGHDVGATLMDRTLAQASPRAFQAPSADTLPPITVRSVERGEAAETLRPADEELTLQALLGSGGMGAVWLGRQRSLSREVAVKTVHPDATDDVVRALCEEAVVTGALEHPSVVPVHALAQDTQGRPLLVMKRVDGVSWGDLLGGRGRIPRGYPDDGEARLDWHLDVLERVCHALELAHSRGIVHRDLKPDNVMVGDFGEVYLVDWGIATAAGPRGEGEPLMGTPVYMAPEMVAFGALDARTDVYLLGGVLHEVLTGRPPHAASDLRIALHLAHESKPPKFDDDVPPELAELCARSLSKAPDDRPESAEAFRRGLAEHRRHRASRALMRGADESLEALRRLVDEASGPDDLDLPAVRRAVAEARFGYRQALAAWAGNAGAEAGLADCLRLAVEAECLRRDVDAARAWLAELEATDEELLGRVERLRAEIAEEQAERERVDRLVRELDPSVGARFRAVVCGLILVLTGAMTWVILGNVEAGVLPSSLDLVVFASGVTLLIGGVVAAFRERLLTTTFNRRLWTWALGALGTIVLHRIVTWLSGEGAVTATLARDLAILSGLAWLAGFWLFRWLFFASAGLAGAAIWAALEPSLSYLLFSVSPPLMLAGFLLGWQTGRRGRRVS